MNKVIKNNQYTKISVIIIFKQYNYLDVDSKSTTKQSTDLPDTSDSGTLGQSMPLFKLPTLNPDTTRSKQKKNTGLFCILVIRFFSLLNEL